MKTHTWPSALPATAVGLGFRRDLAGDLLASPGTVNFVEVVAEACFTSRAARREAIALSRVWPVVPHGVNLSLGSAEGIDAERAHRLGTLARQVRAPVVTEHVAFVRAGGREIGHLTQVPLTRAAARVVARNVAAARRCLPDVPLLLENAAWTFRWPDDELDEATFFGEIVERTGCGLLLDLGNLYANALNARADPFAVLAAYPLDRVAMVHVAGGVSEDGFYFDTHAQAVPEPVFELLGHLVERIGPVPVVLERDDGFPPFADTRLRVGPVEGHGHEWIRGARQGCRSRPSFSPEQARAAAGCGACGRARPGPSRSRRPTDPPRVAIRGRGAPVRRARPLPRPRRASLQAGGRGALAPPAAPTCARSAATPRARLRRGVPTRPLVRERGRCHTHCRRRRCGTAIRDRCAGRTPPVALPLRRPGERWYPPCSCCPVRRARAAPGGARDLGRQGSGGWRSCSALRG